MKKADFRSRLLQKGYGNSSADRYLKDVQLFIRWSEQANIPIEQVSYTDLLHYIQIKKKTNQQSSISAMLTSIRHYYDYLQEKLGVGSPPAREQAGLRPRQQPLHQLLFV